MGAEMIRPYQGDVDPIMANYAREQLMKAAVYVKDGNLLAAFDAWNRAGQALDDLKAQAAGESGQEAWTAEEILAREG